ncbi:hypothetical protein [Celeribacter ethanolicus]|uniref:hypothetical protein n=1 Tax=Celeribacter ethanolicus TaxID=1758178 RepID=UPI0008325513|nr:hypothetical protein [Celeribacter ethanolicus]
MVQTALVAAPIFADPLWEPNDFDGVYVRLNDDATNGCWTNIRETKKYAEDQLALAGFNVIDEPEFKAELPHAPHPLLRENIAEYNLHVRASREDSGVCIGYLNSTFRGAIAPGYDQSKLIVGQIGFPYVWTVWDSKNLNEYMFDQVKDTIEAWIKLGIDLDISKTN